MVRSAAALVFALFVALPCAPPSFGQSIGPVYNTANLGPASGTGIVAHINYCLTALLVSVPGTCDASAEPAQPPTLATLTVSLNNVLIILPPVHLTLGNGFSLQVTGSNSGFKCQEKWACIVDAPNNGSVPAIVIGGAGTSGDYIDGVQILGGRLTSPIQIGNSITVTGNAHRVTNNWVQQAGKIAIAPIDCNYCVIQHNIIDQSGAAAISVTSNDGCSISGWSTTGTVATFTCSNDFVAGQQILLGGFLASTFLNNVLGTVLSAGLSSSQFEINFTHASGATDSGTATVTADYNDIGFNLVRDANTGVLVAGVQNTQGQVGAVCVWGTGNLCIHGADYNNFHDNVLINQFFGSADCNNNNSTNTPTSTDTGCSEGLQTTDTAWYTSYLNNRVQYSSKEGYVIGGIGGRVIGNVCDACDMDTNGKVGGGFQFSYFGSTATRGDLVIEGNTCTNSSTKTSMLYCYSLQSTNTSNWTLQDVAITGNVADASNGTAGITNGFRIANTGPNCNVTSWTTNGITNIAIFACTNTFAAGYGLTLNGFMAGSFFNGQAVTVLSAGLSGTQFEASFSHSTLSGSETTATARTTVSLLNVRINGNQTIGSVGNITNPLNLNNYAGFSGAIRLSGNGFNNSADVAPLAGDCVMFDSNSNLSRQPETDAGAPCGVGTVNNGTAHQVAIYSSSGNAVSSDGTLTDDGTTLTYSGSNIIVPNGTVSAPSLVFANASTFGFYSNSASTIALANGSANKFAFGSGAVLKTNSTGIFGWSASADAIAGLDTSLCRAAAGILEVGGSACGTTAIVKAAAYMSVGTTATSNAGCGEGALVGGATAGKFTTSGTTSCSTIITMGNSATAPNGWSCTAIDLTTASDAANPHQKATTTISATFASGTIVMGDTIQFSCIGY